MLRVDIHKSVAKFFQHRQLNGRIIDESTTLAGCREFASYDTVVEIVFDIVFCEERLHIVSAEVEMCLDDTLVGSLLYCLRVGTLSQQQSDGSKNDTLSCSRLSCDDGETGMQLDVESVDKCEVLDI